MSEDCREWLSAPVKNTRPPFCSYLRKMPSAGRRFVLYDSFKRPSWLRPVVAVRFGQRQIAVFFGDGACYFAVPMISTGAAKQYCRLYDTVNAQMPGRHRLSVSDARCRFDKQRIVVIGEDLDLKR